MTKFPGGSVPDDRPEADVAQQQIPVDDALDATLDTDYLDDRSDADANPADVFEQAIDVPLTEDDRA